MTSPQLPAEPVVLPVPVRVVDPAERRRLFWLLSALIVVIGVLLAWTSAQQAGKYSRLYEIALRPAAAASAAAGASTEVVPTASRVSTEELKLAGLMSVAQDILVIRHFTVFLGFVVVMMGCLFVLTGIEAAYELGVQSKSAQSTLKTSSPGLVLITLGAGLVVASLYRNVSLTFPGEGSVTIPIDQIIQPPAELPARE